MQLARDGNGLLYGKERSDPRWQQNLAGCRVSPDKAVIKVADLFAFGEGVGLPLDRVTLLCVLTFIIF